MARVVERGAESEGTAATRKGRRRFGSRVARLHGEHSYRAVLLLIAATFVFASLAGDATWTVSVLLLLEAATLATAIWTSGMARADSKVLIGIVAGATVTALVLPFDVQNWVLASAGLASAALVVATIVAIAVGVVDQNEVNAQSVTGAICIYLLFGIAFLYLYSAIAVLGSGDLFTQGTDGTRSVRLYFSYVTLATVGYGDYTPGPGIAKTLAVLEALMGQLYLVTVLALLVSRLRPRD